MPAQAGDFTHAPASCTWCMHRKMNSPRRRGPLVQRSGRRHGFGASLPPAAGAALPPAAGAALPPAAGAAPPLPAVSLPPLGGGGGGGAAPAPPVIAAMKSLDILSFMSFG